jgi:hypothetical protein
VRLFPVSGTDVEESIRSRCTKPATGMLIRAPVKTNSRTRRRNIFPVGSPWANYVAAWPKLSPTWSKGRLPFSTSRSSSMLVSLTARLLLFSMSAFSGQDGEHPPQIPKSVKICVNCSCPRRAKTTKLSSSPLPAQAWPTSAHGGQKSLVEVAPPQSYQRNRDQKIFEKRSPINK